MQWDVTTAVYLQEFSVAGKELTPLGVCLKPDGTKMYTIGASGVTVDEYDLGTQWDVTTAVYVQEFSVAAKEAAPHGLRFKPDGTKMYTLGVTGDTVDEYDLGTQWDVSTAVYRDEISVAAKELDPHGLYFKPDGTKMYIVGSAGDTVDEYDLGTQWDVTTAVYLQELSVVFKDTYPADVTFKPDGTKMYVVGDSGNSIDEYDVRTQWDVSTAFYRDEILVGAKETNPRGVDFKPDGTKMYTVGYDGDSVDEYDL